MSDEILSFIFYFFILLFHQNHFTYSYSPTILYPSFERIVDQLSFNSTLPICTLLTCKKTETQANFSTINITDEYVFKLASYDKISQKKSLFQRPYLISSTGIYCGKRIKYRNHYIDQFLGIYYAEIPRSLEKPIKKRFNYSIQIATKYSPYCMQSLLMTENLSYGSFVMQNNFNDDCLSLNIYRADLRYGEKRKAIMIFSHGGSNQIGGGSLFDGSILASEGDIIVVTMNFRLNYHGFLSSGDDRIKGNFGLWDQLLAVEWIYENAHLFGGDPKRIVLAGHSAGAGNVMLIPASKYCRGMIKRIISQSGTGLAPWSINHQPKKLIQRLSREFNCEKTNETEMLQCIHKLLQDNKGDFYRLHLSLSIADDNPYPVIDNDFLNDTIENIIQSDAYRNVDLLTGVTLNEGLYFAEYHIGHFYSDLTNQSASIGKRLQTRQKRFIHRNSTAIIPPDIIKTQESLDEESYDNDEDDDDVEEIKSHRKTHVEQVLNYDPHVVLDQFSKLDYVERYINANFQFATCYIDEIKKRYEYPGKDNITMRLKLYIDLVSDLMFNFHMVHCLNLRAQLPNQTSSNYAYIYSHRPTFKARSLFRDHLKTLPHVIGHFAELDYIFGVPLTRGYHQIHRNVNLSYYNYSNDEENFSRQLIRYWTNFIKTGNPNIDSLSIMNSTIEWRPYTENEHNYIFFQLNNIHNEPNYFDSMYYFWIKFFQTELNGGCHNELTIMKKKKHVLSFVLILFVLLIIIIIYFIYKRYRKTKNNIAH
ncbi:unnamed protein product [Rotaria sp. Silwood2]|nr:unnamed protein product [Rotaria sp. Silwood2]CAF3297463.1 unnamed protein product [Rotaria sp. Silwood2]CAF4138101.1 unnamed protein product [Rotaria sp. Silwood2]CAF4336879.1 unnamed protein product [Rotaria sp. Silwood2]